MLILGFLLALVFIYDEASANECDKIRKRIVSDIHSSYNVSSIGAPAYILRATMLQDLYFEMECRADELAIEIIKPQQRMPKEN